MRNPNRIEPFINQLKTIWTEQCPDWRFGQLISNLESYIDSDLFYIEDDEMMKYINEYFKISTKKSQ